MRYFILTYVNFHQEHLIFGVSLYMSPRFPSKTIFGDRVPVMIQEVGRQDAIDFAGEEFEELEAVFMEQAGVRVGRIQCDICSHIWETEYGVDQERIPCPNCKQDAVFELVD